MSEDDRNGRVGTMQCHLDIVYNVFRAFCNETKPENVPLKNYMKFLSSCISDMLEDVEE